MYLKRERTRTRQTSGDLFTDVKQWSGAKQLFLCFRVFLTEPKKETGYTFLKNRIKPNIIAALACISSKPGDFACVGEDAGIWVVIVVDGSDGTDVVGIDVICVVWETVVDWVVGVTVTWVVGTVVGVVV